jgi:hypothetical protein
VADHLGIGWRFFEGRNEELRGFHGAILWAKYEAKWGCEGAPSLDAAQVLCIMNEV